VDRWEKAAAVIPSVYADGRLVTGWRVRQSLIVLTALRSLAREKGVAVPTTPEDDARIRDDLLRALAYARWGESGLYRLGAVLDAHVRRAVEALTRAAALDGVTR
jgi:hypothetical protein